MLAGHLKMTVAECKERVSQNEFMQWTCFNQVSPWTPDRQDILFAKLEMLLAQIHCGKKGKKYKLKDFLINWDKKQQSVEDMMRIKDAFVKMHNAKYNKRNGG
jgi:hypothetical protein